MIDAAGKVGFISGLKLAREEKAYASTPLKRQNDEEIKIMPIVRPPQMKILGPPLREEHPKLVRTWWQKEWKTRLATWKSRYLPFGGQINLIKAAISNILSLLYVAFQMSGKGCSY